MTSLRKCSNCFTEKPKIEFYRKLSGLQSRCKACNAEVVRGYMQRKKDRMRYPSDFERYGHKALWRVND